MIQGNRENTYDLLRIINAIGVISIHVSTVWLSANTDAEVFSAACNAHLLSACLWNVMVRFAVSCFIMMSGAKFPLCSWIEVASLCIFIGFSLLDVRRNYSKLSDKTYLIHFIRVGYPDSIDQAHSSRILISISIACVCFSLLYWQKDSPLWKLLSNEGESNTHSESFKKQDDLWVGEY